MSPPGQKRWLLGALLAMAVLPLLAVWWLKLGARWPCPAQYLFSLPCGACGGIRALASLATFELGDALRFNPLVTVLATAAPVLAVWKDKMTGPVWFWSAWSALLLNWIYLLAVHVP